MHAKRCCRVSWFFYVSPVFRFVCGCVFNSLSRSLFLIISHHHLSLQPGVSLLSGAPKIGTDIFSPRNSSSPPCLIHENIKDSIAAFGELLSASLIASALNCDTIDSRTLIRTDDVFGNANVDFAATAALCEKAKLSSYKLVVIPGFIASTKDGLTSVLGRGGSDYTATIIGSTVKASRVIIWSDCCVMSGDPRVVTKGTFPLTEISYRESKEMAFFGSKILYSKMIDCCEKVNIPIEVRKTTLDLDSPVTLISNHSTLKAAVSCIQKVAVSVVSGSGMKGLVGTAAKVFLALKDAKV